MNKCDFKKKKGTITTDNINTLLLNSKNGETRI